MNVLVGDLGGTKTILAVVSEETGPHHPLLQRSYSSQRYKSLEAIISEYLKESSVEIQQACLAVAGPITNGRASITNLSWKVDSQILCTSFGLSSAQLVNDLEAVAYAIPVLDESDLYTLHEGTPIAGGTISVIAPGTGLGEAFLTFDQTGHHAHASEGSHVSFGPSNDLQMKLLDYMRHTKGFEHVSYERVCSGGLGFPNLYHFFRDSGLAHEPAWLAEKLINCDDPTPLIIETAKNPGIPSEISKATLELFCEILAVEAGNQALKVLATGGIYLGGGIPPRILDELSKPVFLETLANKGRFKELISNMPVKVILNPLSGLIGAAAFGLDQFRMQVQ